jgi:AcrR family transcriptional regulator
MNMNRREASKKETKRLILKAARTLFARKGMEECTIRDIAKKAGVSPASVVVHFKSKTALLEEALCGDIESALTKIAASISENYSLLDHLMHLSRGFFSLYDKNRDLYRALIRSTVFEPASETPLMSNLSERYIQFLSHIVEEQKARGVILPEVDCRIAAGSVFSLYMGALIMFLRMPEMTVDMVSDVLTSMTDQYLKGITKNHQ